MIAPHHRVPCILIASQGEWVGRSVESVLEQNGYIALRVESGRRALELARNARPDGLLVDISLPDLGGVELCRTLRDDPLFDRSTPIFVTAPAPVSNRVRASVYEAGGWDFCSQPLDMETVLLKLGTYLRAREQGTHEGTSLLDPVTGVYTTYGLRHWAEHLGARAARKHEAFACVAVTMMEEWRRHYPTRLSSEELATVAGMCVAESRKSDVVAHMGDNQFAILAPDTDAPGARGLVNRLRSAAQRSRPEQRGQQVLQAGFCAVPDFGSAGVPAIEVVRRAQMALQFTLADSTNGGPVSFDDLRMS